MMRKILLLLAVLAISAGVADAKMFGESVPAYRYELYVIAGPSREGEFPPGLNTATPPSDLRPDETPDGYGYDLAKDGYIAKGTIPSGSARINYTTNLSSKTYTWAYQRLWLTNGTTLSYGAPYYNDVYVPQSAGKLVFSEDANALMGILPFAPDSLFVFKSTCGYIAGNCADDRGYFQRTQPLQGMGATGITCTVELDGIVYASNGNGLFACDASRRVTELTRPIRNDLSGFTNLALVADYDSHRVIGGSVLVWDAETKKLFRYSGSNFRFTTRQFRLPDWKPFMVDRLLFTIYHPTAGNGRLTYQVKFEDEPWSREYTCQLPYQEEKYTVVSESLEQPRSVHKLQVRITDIVGGKYLKEIRLDSSAFSLDDYVL